MNNLPVVYLYANLILPCIDAIEYVTNVFSIKIPKMQEGEGREWIQATLAIHRHCHVCHHPPKALDTWWKPRDLLWTPEVQECLRAVTQAKAVDLSRNFSINSVDLGSSPTRSSYGKRNLSGSSRTVRDHPGGGVQSQPPADVPQGTLGTWPLGRRRLLPQAASLRGCQNTNPVPVLRAFSA